MIAGEAPRGEDRRPATATCEVLSDAGADEPATAVRALPPMLAVERTRSGGDGPRGEAVAAETKLTVALGRQAAEAAVGPPLAAADSTVPLGDIVLVHMRGVTPGITPPETQLLTEDGRTTPVWQEDSDAHDEEAANCGKGASIEPSAT